MPNEIFVNLPVKDLNETVAFFTKLDFKFNPQFTDQNATCMIIGKNMFVMLLVGHFFKTFIPQKEIVNTKTSAEVIVALSVSNRQEVDEMIEKAVNAGGNEYRETQDHGWMYLRAFEDINGHIWEVFYMDASKMPKEMKDK